MSAELQSNRVDTEDDVTKTRKIYSYTVRNAITTYHYCILLILYLVEFQLHKYKQWDEKKCGMGYILTCVLLTPSRSSLVISAWRSNSACATRKSVSAYKWCLNVCLSCVIIISSLILTTWNVQTNAIVPHCWLTHSPLSYSLIFKHITLVVFFKSGIKRIQEEHIWVPTRVTVRKCAISVQRWTDLYCLGIACISLNYQNIECFIEKNTIDEIQVKQIIMFQCKCTAATYWNLTKITKMVSIDLQAKLLCSLQLTFDTVSFSYAKQSKK